MSTQMEWDLFDNPAPLINMASRSIARLGERRIKHLGFSIGQMPVLYLLRDGGSMSQKELAKQAKIEQPSMAQMLTRMERDGLIARTPDPADGRSSLISLTEKALAKTSDARAALAEGSEESLSDFTAEERKTLVEMLRRLNARLHAIITEEEG